MEFDKLDDPGWRILMALLWKSGIVEGIAKSKAVHLHFVPILIIGDLSLARVPEQLLPCVSSWTARLSAYGNVINLAHFMGPMDVPPPSVVIPMDWEKVDGLLELACKETLDTLNAKHTPREAVEEAIKRCRFVVRAAIMIPMSSYIPVYIDKSQSKKKISGELEPLLEGRQGRDAWKPLHRHLRYHRIKEALDGQGDPSLYGWIASKMFSDEGRVRASRKSRAAQGPGPSESCPAVEDGIKRVDWLLGFLGGLPMMATDLPDPLPSELIRGYFEEAILTDPTELE
jgi:hypothetical protein